jgi:hypothetical protein
LCAVVIAGGVLVSLSGRHAASAGCVYRQTCESAALPAAVTVTAGAVTYLIGRDGRVHRVPDQGNLRVAALRQAAPIPRDERPLGRAPGGLYTYRYRDSRLLLDTAGRTRTIARWPLGSDYFATGGNLYFIEQGVVMSAHGALVRRLASLRHLGFSPNSALLPVGRLLELEDDRGIAVLRPDGSVLARTALPRRSGETEAISSGLVVEPDGSTVAFTAAAGQSNDPKAAQRAHGSETVYLLRPGARRAVAVHTEPVAFEVCERGAALQWRQKWLLYINSEGHLTLIDSAHPGRAIQLSRFVHSLAGMREGVGASWAGQQPAL